MGERERNAKRTAARGENEDEGEGDKGEKERRNLSRGGGGGGGAVTAERWTWVGEFTRVDDARSWLEDDRRTVGGASVGTTTADDDSGVFDETEMTTTTATATATPVPAPSSSMSSMAMSSLGASTTTTYENTNAARGSRQGERLRRARRHPSIRSRRRQREDSSGMTLLHLACLFNRATAVETLLELGADPELRNAQGETAMDVAPPDDARSRREDFEKS